LKSLNVFNIESSQIVLVKSLVLFVTPVKTVHIFSKLVYKI